MRNNYWLDRRYDRQVVTPKNPQDDAWNKRWQQAISQQGSTSISYSYSDCGSCSGYGSYSDYSSTS